MNELIELLPLPEKSEIDRHLPTGVRVYGYTADDMKTYASACVAHATTAKDAEIERLKVVAHGFVDEIAARETKIEALRAKAAEHRDGRLAALERAERMAEALREAEKDLRQLSVIDCGCKPCRRACRTGKGAEWELESRMKTAHAAANKARAALLPTDAQENDDA